MGNSSSQTSKWDDLFQALTKPEDMRAYLEHNSQQDGDRQSTLELQCELLVGTVQVEPTLLKLSEVAESFDTAVFCLGQLVSHEPKTMSELPFARTVVSGLSSALTKGWSIHHGVAKFAANALTILCICEEAELAVREFAIQELVAGIAQWLQSTDEPEELDEVCGCSCGSPALSATCWIERLLGKPDEVLQRKLRLHPQLIPMTADLLRVVSRHDGNPFALTRLLCTPSLLPRLLGPPHSKLTSEALSFVVFGIQQFDNPAFTEDGIKALLALLRQEGGTRAALEHEASLHMLETLAAASTYLPSAVASLELLATSRPGRTCLKSLGALLSAEQVPVEEGPPGDPSTGQGASGEVREDSTPAIQDPADMSVESLDLNAWISSGMQQSSQQSSEQSSLQSFSSPREAFGAASDWWSTDRWNVTERWNVTAHAGFPRANTAWGIARALSGAGTFVQSVRGIIAVGALNRRLASAHPPDEMVGGWGADDPAREEPAGEAPDEMGTGTSSAAAPGTDEPGAASAADPSDSDASDIAEEAALSDVEMTSPVSRSDALRDGTDGTVAEQWESFSRRMRGGPTAAALVGLRSSGIWEGRAEAGAVFRALDAPETPPPSAQAGSSSAAGATPGTAPAAAETVAAATEPARAATEIAPATSDAAPSTTQAGSSSSDGGVEPGVARAATETAPATTEATPAATETAPATTEATSAAAETAPATTEATPAATETDRVPTWPARHVQPDVVQAWVVLEVAGLEPAQEEDLLGRMTLAHKRIWLLHRLRREHHISPAADEDPILFVECTREDTDGAVFRELRDQCNRKVGLGSEDLSGTLEVHFKDENSAGDAVKREWFSVVSDAFLDPKRHLLVSPDGGRSFRPRAMGPPQEHASTRDEGSPVAAEMPGSSAAHASSPSRSAVQALGGGTDAGAGATEEGRMPGSSAAHAGSSAQHASASSRSAGDSPGGATDGGASATDEGPSGRERLLRDYEMLGRFVGLALLQQVTIGVRLHPSVCRLLLSGGEPYEYTHEDVAELDPMLLQHKVQYILENDVDMLCLDFTEVVEDVAASEDELAAGEKMAAAERRVELKPGGAEIEVTNENKAEYADLVCRWRLMGSIHEPVQAMLRGLHVAVPARVMAKLSTLVTPSDLASMLAGEPDIDLNDWRRHCLAVGGLERRSRRFRWFWRAVRSLEQVEREQLLQFVTGSRRPPAGGFAQLQGFHGGVHKFTLCAAAHQPKDSLPKAHACICTMDLPEYSSYATLRRALHTAVTMGSVGFDDAAVAGRGDESDADGEGVNAGASPTG